MPERFRKNLRPHPEVVKALEFALQAARNGHARAVVIVISNPVHEVETAIAGTVQGAARHVLIGGLSSAAHKLIANHTHKSV